MSISCTILCQFSGNDIWFPIMIAVAIRITEIGLKPFGVRMPTCLCIQWDEKSGSVIYIIQLTEKSTTTGSSKNHLGDSSFDGE